MVMSTTMGNNLAQTSSGMFQTGLGSAASQFGANNTAAQLDAISLRNQQMALDAARRDQQMKETEALCDALKTGPKAMQNASKETLQGV